MHIGSQLAESNDNEDEPKSTILTLALLVVTILLSIGSPLLGLRTFAPSDVLLQFAPWSGEAPSGFQGKNPLVTDPIDALLPMYSESRQSIRGGDYPLWTGLPSGGTPIVPYYGALSLMNVPYLVLPLRYAPAATKLLEMGIAAGFTYLFLRRIHISRQAALVGAFLFVNSGYQVVWTNWPQSQVGALIPALFWSVEATITAPTLRRSAFIAAITALMWLAGFPAVAVYALLAAAVYAIVRMAALWRRKNDTGNIPKTLSMLSGGAAAGIALAAMQLLPLFYQLRNIDLAARASMSAGRHLPFAGLLTLAIPDAFGSPVDRVYYADVNYVELQSFIGVVALALVALAFTCPPSVRPRPGVRSYFIPAAAVLIALIYIGGPLLDALQMVPLFRINFIGRLRSVLGFVLAALGALGFQGLLSSTSHAYSSPRRYVQPMALVAMATPFILALAWPWQLAAAEGRQLYFVSQLAVPGATALLLATALAADGMASARQRRRLWLCAGSAIFFTAAIGIGFLLAAVGADPRIWGQAHRFLKQLAVPVAVGLTSFLVAARFRGTPRLRLLIIIVPVLIVVESLAFARPFWPRIPPAQFYPTTDTHTFLDKHIGYDRLVAENRTLYPGTTTFYGLRSVTGHVFAHPRWRDLLIATDASVYERSRTFSFFEHDLGVATSPILDRLAAKYYVAAPDQPLFGLRADGEPHAGTATLESGVVHIATLPRKEVRGIEIDLLKTLDQPLQGVIHVDIVDGSDRVISKGKRDIDWRTPTGTFTIPVVEGPSVEATPIKRARAQIRVEAESGAINVSADTNGDVVVSSIVPQEDGLRVVFVDGAVVYERQNALPRFRWASRAAALPDPQARVARLASGVADNTVLLESAGPKGSGDPALVRVLSERPNEVLLEVQASGSGYLVVADAMQDGWSAEVDGAPVALQSADHALVAVHLSRGLQLVRLVYEPAGWRSGLTISGVATILIGVMLALVGMRERRRRWRSLGLSVGERQERSSLNHLLNKIRR